MTQSEFLQELRQALENDLSGNIISENVEYYRQYITDEVQKGKSEDEVLQMLGDPWILARTVIDAADGTDKSTVYEAGGDSYSGYDKRTDYETRTARQESTGAGTWWKKILLILGIVMIIFVVVSIITGVISFLAPVLVPLLIVMIVVRVLGNRRR